MRLNTFILAVDPRVPSGRPAVVVDLDPVAVHLHDPRIEPSALTILGVDDVAHADVRAPLFPLQISRPLTRGSRFDQGAPARTFPVFVDGGNSADHRVPITFQQSPVAVAPEVGF